MKMLIKPLEFNDKLNNYDGIILPLKDYSVNYNTYFNLEEIKSIKEKYNKEIFIVINRMIMNNDLESLKNILLEIEKLNIKGIFYYDISILELKKELNLKTDLVWNANHMVTNYETCNYYYSKGVKYAYLSNEITLEEDLEILKRSKIIPMITMVALPVIADSYRRLLTNYSKAHNKEYKEKLVVTEKVTNEEYLVEEDKYGTTFKYNKILNNIKCLEKLKEINFPYLVFIEDGIDSNNFYKSLDLIKSNIENNTSIEEVYNLLGRNTGFSYRKTIYRVNKKWKR